MNLGAKAKLVIATGVSILVIAPSAATAIAQEPQTVPEVVQIVDPAGDANYLNDQGFGGIGGTPKTGDNTTPVDAGSVSDLLAVWFTNDADTISAHIQTEAPAPATAALVFRVQTNPTGDRTCLWFEAFTPGQGNPSSEPTGQIQDICNGPAVISEATVELSEGPDGTGIITITALRDSNGAFVDGSVFMDTIAHSRHYINGVTIPQIDETKPGTEYTVTTPEEPSGDQHRKKCTKKRAAQRKCKRG